LVKQRRYLEAIKACERILEIDPEFVPAMRIIETIAKDPAARNELAGIEIKTPKNDFDAYDRLVAGNLANQLARIMTRFYGDVGAEIRDVRLMKGLDRFRSVLAAQNAAEGGNADAHSVLVNFEIAWSHYLAEELDKALPMFDAIFGDGGARQRAAFDPLTKEAVVRSGEILGRRQDKLGNADTAISIYREIALIDPGSPTIRRLILLLSRRGLLQEAASLAEAVVVTKQNIYPGLPDNPYIATLKAALREPRISEHEAENPSEQRVVR
jgi:tetratricopeptide (TPR) repeat protein